MVVKKKNKEYCNRYLILHRAFSGVRQAFFVMSSHSCGNLQINEGHSISEATSLLKIAFFVFLAQKYICQQKQGNDIPTTDDYFIFIKVR